MRDELNAGLKGGAMIENAISILEKLVSFPSISGQPTHGIVGYIKEYLESHGLEVTLSSDEAGERSNVYATIGPDIDGGVVLNGHTDVVPVTGQDWATDPFTLTRKGDRFFGRGSVDMKGFLACVLAAVPALKAMDLKRPVHIAFSFDEETGGFGMPYLIRSIEALGRRPAMVIVGEPTDMNIVTGHKGGCELRTEITGFEVHSCNPLRGVSAISAAMKLISKIEELGARVAANPRADSPFDPAYGTFNVGTIEGGAVRNATAGWCNFDWEYRALPGEDHASLLKEISDYAQEVLLPPMKAVNEAADIRIILEVDMPAMDDRNAEAAAQFVSEVTGQNSRNVVSFGTDGGYFSAAGYSTVICGPGSINRAHAPDEYIELSELEQGVDFVRRIGEALSR